MYSNSQTFKGGLIAWINKNEELIIPNLKKK